MALASSLVSATRARNHYISVTSTFIVSPSVGERRTSGGVAGAYAQRLVVSPKDGAHGLTYDTSLL